MKKRRFERCPCGSGKPRDECCGNPAQDRARLAVMIVLILVVGGAAMAMAFSFLGEGDGDIVAATPQPLAVGETPEPFEYDPVTNRHWHSEHGHWHDGLPPGANDEIANTLTTDVGTPLAEGADTPAAWAYDAENDRHWHSGHGHWHDGAPPYSHPQIAAAQTPEQLAQLPERLLNPKANYYDPSVDMHWDPAHEHWHNGPPPSSTP